MSFKERGTFLVAQLVKNLLYAERPGFDPWVGKIPWRRERLPTPVFWPGEFHRLYSPWGCKESDTTERLSLSPETSRDCIKTNRKKAASTLSFPLSYPLLFELFGQMLPLFLFQFFIFLLLPFLQQRRIIIKKKKIRSYYSSLQELHTQDLGRT